MENTRRQDIVIKLESFDHRLLDQAVSEIVHSIHATGAKVKGPIPFPVKIERFTVNRSPHVDKKSREQFEIRTHYRVMVVEPYPQTIEALKKLELTSGVNVRIKVKSKKTGGKL
jgi:small subunit ribosomal protein S10